jgi:hypothetical protein
MRFMASSPGQAAAGSSTRSMTWMIPFEASMSALTTPAPATWIPPSVVIGSSPP